MVTICPVELMHYGVLGMKWGVRRYQPYSQKPRMSGKAGKEIGEAKKKSMFDQTIKVKDSNPISPAEKTSKDISRALESTTKVLRNTQKIKSDFDKESQKSKTMSDEELRRVVNRLDLEKRYESLTKEETMDNLEKATTIIEMAKDVAIGIGAVAAAYATLRPFLNK